MVFYFTTNVVSPPMLIYVGRDKHENEELIKWGWPEDIWFHVDKMSSAHIYLRLPEGQSIDDIPHEVLVDCAQLTKANSIQGSKCNDVAIVYTPWSNLKKTADMDVGQVGFHKQKLVKTIVVEKKVNEIINRLNKTKEEEDPNFRELREERDRKERIVQRKLQQEQKIKEKQVQAERKKEAEERSYDRLMREEVMVSNKSCVYGVPLQDIQLQKDFKRALTDDGWFIGANGKQYHLSKNENGFYESGDYCQDNGGNLVTISSEKDQEAVNSFISASQPKDGQFYWLGLHEGTGSSSTSWIWQKNNALALYFLNWAPGQPASNNPLQDCGAVGTDGTWFSKNCDMKLFGLCEKQGPLIMPTSMASKGPGKDETSNEAANAAKGNQTSTNGKPSDNNNDNKKPAEEKKQPSEVEQMKAKFNNGERCNLINFINHIGNPIMISRIVNDGASKDYIVEGENYRLNTVFKKIENPKNMEPVIYKAREIETDKYLALDGKDSLTLIPGDCDGDFVDVIVSPRPVEEDIVSGGQRSGLKHGYKKFYGRHPLKSESMSEDEEKASKPRCSVKTFGGSSDDASCCHFPFKFNNRLYHDCTSTSKHHLWCGTSRDFDSDKRWGYCCLEGECTD